MSIPGKKNKKKTKIYTAAVVLADLAAAILQKMKDLGYLA